MDGGATQAPIITLDEETLKGELKDLVRKTVEEVVNGILDAQADEMVNAGRYERTDERQAYRSGHYTRGLLTQAGRIEVSVPKLRGTRLTSEVIERYQRRESSVEEALMEMYLLGVSTRNVEEVTRILWGEGVSAGTVSNPSQEAFERVEEKAADLGVPLRLRRRDLREEGLGRRLRERGGARGDRGELGGLPRGRRRRGGLQGVAGLLARVPARPQIYPL